MSSRPKEERCQLADSAISAYSVVDIGRENRSTIFMAIILLVVMCIAVVHAQHASVQTVHAAGSTNIVDANCNRVGKIFDPSTR